MRCASPSPPVEHGVELPRVTLRVPAVQCAQRAGVTAAARAGAGADRRENRPRAWAPLRAHTAASSRLRPSKASSFLPRLRPQPGGISLGHSAGGRRCGDHRLFVVCQPHTYSRTKLLFDQYMTCFTGADEVLITDIYAAREKDPGDIHATMLVDALSKASACPPFTHRILMRAKTICARTGSRATS